MENIKYRLFRKKIDKKLDYPQIRYGKECTHQIAIETTINHTKYNTAPIQTFPSLLKPDVDRLMLELKKAVERRSYAEKLHEQIYIFNHTNAGKRASFVVMNENTAMRIMHFYPINANPTLIFEGCEVLRSYDLKEGEFRIG